MRIVPVIFVWQKVEVIDPETGETTRRLAMVPLTRYGNIAGRQFSEDEAYPLTVVEARSRASHNAYFAELHRGFGSMPEGEYLQRVAERLHLKLRVPPLGFADVEHFRAWALCETGWHEKPLEMDLSTKDSAMALAQFFRRNDDYAYISVSGTHVTVKVPKSQSGAAMGKGPFEESKKDVLDLMAAMLGVKRETLKKEGRSSA